MPLKFTIGQKEFCMSGPSFQNSLSWNAIIPMVVAVVSVGIAYGNLDSGQSQISDRLESERSDRQAEVRRLERQFDRDTEALIGTMEEIGSTMRDTRERVRNIETREAAAEVRTQNLTREIAELRSDLRDFRSTLREWSQINGATPIPIPEGSD